MPDTETREVDRPANTREAVYMLAADEERTDVTLPARFRNRKDKLLAEALGVIAEETPSEELI